MTTETTETTESRENVVGFAVTVDGATYPICRDVCYEHPAEVHAAFMTESEIDIQLVLDAVRYDDWFTADGRYLGCDCNGLGLRFEQ
jgi:hypothetical protein